MDRLPTDIITIILTYLPVKSVLRCRSVCKTWRAIIDSLQFPEQHFNASPPTCNSSSFIILPFDFNEIYISYEDEKLPNILKTTKITLSCGIDLALLIPEPSVNGLILFCSAYKSYFKQSHDSIDMYICNPATRDCVKLPNLIVPECATAKLVSGLGFDTIRKEIKVVQIFYQLRDVSNSEVQVYSLGSNSWKKIGKAPNVKFRKYFRAFVSGSLHWLAEGQPEDGYDSMLIVSFNLGSETFGFVPCPNISVLEYKLKNLEIMSLGGRLSVIDDLSAHNIEIWIMKEYNVKESWARVLVSKFDLDGVRCEKVQPILFWKNGEILLLYERMKLVSYNMKNGNFTSLEDGLPGLHHEKDYDIFSYDESLISLNLR